MTYYYPTGTILPPQQPGAPVMPVMNEKPGIYGAFNGGVPVTVASRPVMSTGIQYIQTSGLVQGGLPPGSQVAQVPVISQARPPGPAATAQGPPMGMPTATPYPVSSAPAGYCTQIQQSPYMATAGLYQGASLAYPQPNMSPAVPTVSGSPYTMGRSVSPAYPYAGSQHISSFSNSTYPGTVVGGVVPVGFQAASGAPPAAQPPPTYSISTDGIMPTPPQHIRTAAPTGMPGAPVYQQQPSHAPAPPGAGGLQSFPPGAVIGASHAGMPGMSPAIGAPLVANPNFPGVSPYQRSMP